LWKCQHYEEQIGAAENAGEGALAGAAVESVTTAAVGAILGRDLGRRVAVGAAAGASAAMPVAQDQKDIIRNKAGDIPPAFFFPGGIDFGHTGP
jgi:outer membrane lipoprotein SlyB